MSSCGRPDGCIDVAPRCAREGGSAGLVCQIEPAKYLGCIRSAVKLLMGQDWLIDSFGRQKENWPSPSHNMGLYFAYGAADRHMQAGPSATGAAGCDGAQRAAGWDSGRASRAEQPERGGATELLARHIAMPVLCGPTASGEWTHAW